MQAMARNLDDLGLDPRYVEWRRSKFGAQLERRLQEMCAEPWTVAELAIRAFASVDSDVVGILAQDAAEHETVDRIGLIARVGYLTALMWLLDEGLGNPAASPDVQLAARMALELPVDYTRWLDDDAR